MSKTVAKNKTLKTLKVKIKLDYPNQLRLETLSNEHRQLYNHLMEFVKSNKTSDFKAINNKVQLNKSM